ncbi:MAG: endolytic transglycosylase MltG [Oscillospiraceae bacterium]|jgi:UPF0755 protein|nr:endolytic transglycosylase MltG [Oscillospiraceae bacterium]
MDDNKDYIDEIINGIQLKSAGGDPPGDTDGHTDGSDEYRTDEYTDEYTDGSLPDEFSENYEYDIPEPPDPEQYEQYEEYMDVPPIGERPPRPKREVPENVKKRRRMPSRRKSKFSFAIVCIMLVIGASVVLSMYLISMGQEYLGSGKSSSEVRVTVPKGATVVQIAEMLRDKEIIKSVKMFQLFSKLKKADGDYKAGDHFIRPNMSYDLMIDKLSENPEDDTSSLTFPEGKDLYSMAKLLEDSGYIASADTFIEAFNSGEYLTNDYKFTELFNMGEKDDKRFYNMEGYFFPDTYMFFDNLNLQETDTVYSYICEKIYTNFDNKINALRSKIDACDYTLDEIITMASVVQLEAPFPKDMKQVADVFYNRLTKPEGIGREVGMLESDPTKGYGSVIQRHIKQSANSDAIVEAYNTYLSAGLPPGPICNPGLEAIDATLDALLDTEESPFYYFCANIDTQVTLFAATYEEHLENLDKIAKERAETTAQDS